MHVMVRRYRVGSGQMDELAHRVDMEFADMLAREPGFMDYQVIDCADGTAVSITMFADADQAEHSNDMAAEWVAASCGDLDIERIDAWGGEALVSRAAESVLEPAHH